MEIKNLQDKVLSFLDKNSNLILIAILIFALILRLKYFNINQAVWYDEATYLSAAKSWAFGIPYEIEFVRPIFLPFMMAMFYNLGATELALRVLILIFSMAGVLFTYLVGKEMFDKKIALIAAFITSFFYVNLFYTARIMTETPSMVFWLISLWLFWKGYVKNESKIYLWFFGFFMILGILTRFPSGLLGIIILFYLLLTDKFRFLKNKNLWIAVTIAVIILIPYSIWYYTTYQKIPIIGAAGFYHSQNYLYTYISMLPMVFQSPIPALSEILPWGGHFFIILLFLAIAVIIFNLIMGYDMLTKEERLKKNLLMILWTFIPFFYFAFLAGQFPEDRYLFFSYPAAFYLVGFGFMFIYDKFKKYSKFLMIILIILVLSFVSYGQINYADSIIKIKSSSYIQFKHAGEFIKANSNHEDKIISTGAPQLTYYSERKVIYWPEEEDIKKFIEENNDVRFIVLSLLEQSPPWTYTWPEKNSDKIVPIEAYLDQQQRPILIIYEIKR